jgi:hypothetical protein
MFDLEKQLEQWKQRFATFEGMRRSDLEELEQHVRDSVVALTSIGLNAEEAFVVATYRVGAPGPVVHEFAKVNGSHIWAQRVFWMTVGALGYAALALVIGALAALSQVVVSLAGATGAAVGYTAVGVTCLAWGALAAFMYNRRNEPARFSGLSSGVIASLVACSVVVASGMKFGTALVLPRLMPVPELAEVVMISNAATLLSTVLLPLVLLIVILSLRRHMVPVSSR